MASLTDPRRDLSYIQLESRHQSGVETEDSSLNNSFSLNHNSFIATSCTFCFGNSGRRLNFKSRLCLLRSSISSSMLVLLMSYPGIN